MMFQSTKKRIKTAGISQSYKFINSSGRIPYVEARGRILGLAGPVQKILQALQDPKVFEERAQNFEFSVAQLRIEKEGRNLSSQFQYLGDLLHEHKVEWRTMAIVQQRLDKALASLQRLSKTIENNNWNSYKGKIEVGFRARTKFLGIARTIVEMVKKFQIVLLEQPFIQDPDDVVSGFSNEQWKKIKRLALATFQRAAQAGILLAGPNGTGRPTITDEEIEFNGKKPENYEDFLFVRSPQRLGQIYYCKTENRPYQAAVVAFLKGVVRLAPNVIQIDVEEHEESLRGDWSPPPPL